MARTAGRGLQGLSKARWLHGLGCGAVVALATASAVLAGLLLAPGCAALLLDRGTGRPAARATLLVGAAVAASPVLGLWQSGAGISAAFERAGEAQVLLSCWLAQAAAWLLAQLLPVLIRFALEAHAATAAARLRAERLRYQDEWGVPPNGTA